MSYDCYFGAYARFSTESKLAAAELSGADNIVGDRYRIEFRTEDDITRAWLVNRFGGDAGFLDPALSRRLSILAAREWVLSAYLSFVAYTDSGDPGEYWGEMALICYDPKYEHAFGVFAQRVSAKLADGIRPEVNLGDQGISSVIESDGDWLPKRTIPLPKKAKGSAIIKSRRSASEKLIEQGRKGNAGCYVVSWIFILVVVALVLFGLHSCGVF